MKGIIFREFFEMVDTTISPKMTEKLIAQCDLRSGGAYTSVGTYDHSEIFALVNALSKETGIAAPALIKSFGNYLFARYRKIYPRFFEGSTDAFSFLEQIDTKVHEDVRKIHPEAELPSLKCNRVSTDHLILTYQSTRALGDLAEGLIESTAEHFGETIALERENLSSCNGQHIRFSLTRRR